MKLTVFLLILTFSLSSFSDYTALDEFDVINFGELHGSNEMPKYFFNLAIEFAEKYPEKKIAFGLEIPKSEQKYINRVIKRSKDKPLKKSKIFNKEYQDGRASKAMVEGIIKLSKYKNIKVFCFDQNLPYDDNRDKEMAENIKAMALKKKFHKVFTYSGNVHPRKTKGTPWDKAFKPMGFFLSKILNKKVISIRGVYEKGSVWVCQGMTANTCGIAKFKDTVKSKGLKRGLNMLPKQKGGYDAYVYMESLTPSLPWKQ